MQMFILVECVKLFIPYKNDDKIMYSCKDRILNNNIRMITNRGNVANQMRRRKKEWKMNWSEFNSVKLLYYHFIYS